ncbi:hypothetical protein A0H81_06173 [Grifola frondosa]|uniref:Uncharacterized protein n=1 Tax=Grifola frondosa TaxID=5627 RepID=A0A1C7MB35_GRIFR|nr:hypothetical protein A0H81_06173 [Grifola frondosa]
MVIIFYGLQDQDVLCRNMDAVLTPPLRIQAARAEELSSKVAQSRIDDFLHDFRNRSIVSNNGDTTISDGRVFRNWQYYVTIPLQ